MVALLDSKSAIAHSTYRRHLGKMLLADTPLRELGVIPSKERYGWTLAADAIDGAIAAGLTEVNSIAEMGYDCYENVQRLRTLIPFKSRPAEVRSAWNAVVLAMAQDFAKRNRAHS